MSFRNTIILAVVVAIFGAYLYYVEKPAIEREAEQGKLLDVDTSKVVRIELESTKGRIELAKGDGDTWTVTAPRETAADQVTVDGLLATLQDAAVKKTLDETSANLAPFGLDAPEASVVLTLADGTSRKLSFGKKTPIGGSAYARRGDDGNVLLTADTVRTGMQKELNDVRDKTVFTFSDADVKEITITGVEGEPTVLRKEGTTWALVSPVGAKADAAQVRSMLASLRSLRATGFVDDAGTPPDAKYHLSPARVTVELVLAPDDAKRTLLVGGATDDPKKKEIYAQSLPGDTVYVVGSHLYSMAAKRAMDFRDKTVLAFDKDAVTSVAVERSDRAGFTLEKKDGKWTLADAGDAGVKEFVASRLVDDLRELKGTDIASESGPRPEFGLDQPSVTIVLAGAAGTLGTMRIAERGEGADKRIYAAADGSQTVYLLQDYVLQRVDKQRSDFLAAPAPPAAGGTGEAPPATDESADAAAVDG